MVKGVGEKRVENDFNELLTLWERSSENMVLEKLVIHFLIMTTHQVINLLTLYYPFSVLSNLFNCMAISGHISLLLLGELYEL